MMRLADDFSSWSGITGRSTCACVLIPCWYKTPWIVFVCKTMSSITY